MLKPASIVFAFCILPTIAHAADITFTDDGQISAGDFYDRVTTYGNANLIMDGGTVNTELALYDQSTLEMQGGFAMHLCLLNENVVNIYDGTTAVFFATDRSTLNVYGGHHAIFFSDGRGNSTINIYDGYFDYALWVSENAVLNLHGGVFDREDYDGNVYFTYLLASDNSIVNIHGSNFEYNTIMVEYGVWTGEEEEIRWMERTTLSGLWNNGTPFTLWLYDSDTINHINLIPEPSTLALLAFGFPCLVRKGSTKRL